MFANRFKGQIEPMMISGKFIPLKSSNPSVFAYAMSYNGKSVVVIGNLDFRLNSEAFVSVPKLKPENMVIPVKIESIPITQRGGIKVNLSAGETIVLLLDDIEVK